MKKITNPKPRNNKQTITNQAEDFKKLVKYAKTLIEEANSYTTFLIIHGMQKPWPKTFKAFNKLPKHIQETLLKNEK